MVDFRADLHCHSCFSDGTDSPSDLIDHAIASGLSGLSITDHDTLAAYQQALEAAKLRNFPLLSGIEFSAAYRGEPVHILGYAYALKSEAIASLCQRHKQRREERNARILKNLEKFGILINPAELNQQKLKGSCGRPHIAAILMQRGIVSSIQEAFERFLGEGRAAYDPGDPVTVEETISAIKSGHGKAVLAHPHLLKRSTTVRAMLQMPFDGLECYYARFAPEQEKKWLDLANQRKWLITGGSDYHGTTKPYNTLGSSWVNQTVFDSLYTLFLQNN